MAPRTAGPAPWDSWREPSLGELLAGRVGWRRHGLVARGPCPCCPSTTGGWALEQADGRVRVGCWSCDNWPGIRQAFGLDRGDWPAKPRPQGVRAPESHRAPDMVTEADGLHAVYEVLQRHLGMTADQRRTVLGRDRGIPPAIRDAMAPLVGALPRDAREWDGVRRRIVEDLKLAAPDEFLQRVPELAARKGNTYAVLPYRDDAQYFEPWRDEQGRITALRSYHGKRPADGNRYRTTKGRWGPLVHFAFGCELERIAEVPWLFTEAWMKAEVAAHHLGCVAVAFPGVSAKGSWSRGIEVKQRLAPHAPAYLAFDAEVWTTRLDLTVSVLELARRLRDATGHEPGYAVWAAGVREDGSLAAKGVDDAIVAGEPVHLVDRHAFASLLGPVVEEWEVADAA